MIGGLGAGVPPPAAKVAEYGTPTLPPGNDVVVTVTPAPTVIESGFTGEVPPALSFTVTLKLKGLPVAVVGVPKIADRVDGIVQLCARKIFAGFGERWNEMRMLGGGERHHRVAVRKWREMLFELVRGAAGGDEMNFVEIETAVRGARDGKVSIVDGIERAAKYCDTARMMFCRSAVGLRGGQ